MDDVVYLPIVLPSLTLFFVSCSRLTTVVSHHIPVSLLCLRRKKLTGLPRWGLPIYTRGVFFLG